MTKIKHIALGLVGIILVSLVGMGALVTPAEAAIKTTSYYTNGNSRGGLNILINDEPRSRYYIVLRPGQTYPLYGSAKYGWVPSNCELQYRRGASWRVIASARHRQGFWTKLPGSIRVKLHTWCG